MMGGKYQYFEVLQCGVSLAPSPLGRRDGENNAFFCPSEIEKKIGE